MIPRLLLIGGQYVDPTKVVAILVPTSHHVPLTDGADLPLRSVLVLDRNIQPLVPCSATPKTAFEKVMGWYQEIEDANRRLEEEWAEKHSAATGPPAQGYALASDYDDEGPQVQPETARSKK